MIDRHLRGELDEAEKERLARLLNSDPSAQKDFVEQIWWDTQLTEVLRETGGATTKPSTTDNVSVVTAAPTMPVRRALLTIAALIVVALTVHLYFQRPAAAPRIAKITGMGGSLQWTGDGGRVSQDLAIGAELAGSTVEGMTPASWLALQFDDGSTVTISGTSTLTFSDYGQKKLHLKAGSLSCNVKPQPAGRPMLVYTRSAILEVLGTQFEAEAGLSATTLSVSKGRVRVKRLSDGSTVVVPAKHRVLAAADREMLPVSAPEAVSQWRSQLHLGPEGTIGKWSLRTHGEGATLGAVPFTTRLGHTIYTAAFGVSHGDKLPVILSQSSLLRVRGQIASPHKIYFGVTVRHPNGEFAGNFQTTKAASEFYSGQSFELTLAFGDLQLDPSLLPMKDRLPSDPFGLVVESFWCHTLNEPAGLEIAAVELIPAIEEER